MSSKGLSKIYMRPSGMAINQDVYLTECIQKRLVPFIQNNNRHDQYVFWPDMASSHYAASVTKWMDNNDNSMSLKN